MKLRIYYMRSSILIAMIILGNVVYLFFDTDFFHQQFSMLGSYERNATVMEEADILMQYRHDEQILIDRAVYSMDEQRHLYDVKLIIQAMNSLLIWWSIIWCMVCVWVYYTGWRRYGAYLARSFWQVSLILLIVCIALLLVASSMRDQLFDLFHRILFVDNWMFAADSFLIQSYPWQFFRNALYVLLLRIGLVIVSVFWLLHLFKYIQTSR